ncbi:Glycoside family 31 [Micractinium conductrix]|uniref:Glycoside family 31 n=1 Tax=Micractinium conductrix TaxID=554055 RepID=A0A2P6VD72_9CHLO|nr:Glycoside family 31 [Micractinium conductrix]|eukprot:PSC72027.1 Glycoside family 31 [Micractinium conductrix]
MGMWYSAWNWYDTVDATGAPVRTNLTVANSTEAATNVTTRFTPVHFRGGYIIPMQPGNGTSGTPPSTTAVKASPLSFVLPLPGLLAPGNASSAGGDWQYNLTSGLMYNDDGEMLQVGADPCSLLTANSTIAFNTSSGRHTGTLLLSATVYELPFAAAGGGTTAYTLPEVLTAGGAATVGTTQHSVPALNATAAAPPDGIAARVNGTDAPGSLHFDLQPQGLRLPLRCGAGFLLVWSE